MQVSRSLPSEITDSLDTNISSFPQDVVEVQKKKSEVQQQQLIADFSDMFKRKQTSIGSKKLVKHKSSQQKTPNWLLEIPTKLQITKQDLEKRRKMDTNKWLSICKTENENHKLVAAACSCWNYLYSDKGIGKERPISAKQFTQILEDPEIIQIIKQEYEQSRFRILQKIVQLINAKNKTNLAIEYEVKVSFPEAVQLNITEQKNKLVEGLASHDNCYIYLAFNDIFVPIGFDKTPLKQLQAYQKIENIEEVAQELWIISSTVGAKQPSFSIKRWSDIQKDLQTIWPHYFDIKQVKQGVRVRPEATEESGKQQRGTSNSIIRVYIGEK